MNSITISNFLKLHKLKITDVFYLFFKRNNIYEIYIDFQLEIYSNKLFYQADTIILIISLLIISMLFLLLYLFNYN